MDEARQQRAPRRAILAGSIGAIALAGAALWIARADLAGNLIDRRLRAAGVPATYRIASLGPAVQVIEDVRLGDPARPDLVARRVALRWRYRFGLPSLAALEIEGGRLSARWSNGTLSLGSIDRLLPRTGGGGAALPDLMVRLRDSHVALVTPAGTVGLWIEGRGNAARDFSGLARIEAPALTVAGCGLGAVSARLTVRTAMRAPHLRGPIAIAGASCRSPAVAVGAGGAAVDVRLAPSLDRAVGAVSLAGFGGRAGAVTFEAVRGTIGMAGGAAIAGRSALAIRDVALLGLSARAMSLDGRYRYDAKRVAFDGTIGARGTRADRTILASIRSTGAAMAGTPVGPIAGQMGTAVAELADGGDLVAPVRLEMGERRSLQIDRAIVRARGGATAAISATLEARASGWSVAGDLAGTRLPRLALTASRRDADAPIEARLRMEAFRAGTASLAVTPVHVRVDRGIIRFATVATMDGPIGSGSVEGLSLPIAGLVDRRGGVVIGRGCQTIGFRRLRLSGMMLDPARVALCGNPIVARSGTGAMRIAGDVRGLAMTGRSGTAPLTLHTGPLRFSERGFAVEGIAITIGAADDPTRLELASMAGAIRPGGAGGTFAGAAGGIGHVPLALSGATGTWRLAGGALHLAGGLQVADSAPLPRFLPLTTRDVALDLADGRIVATATLQAPGRAATIAGVQLHHDLASGGGGATLDVPGIAFVRGGLQPEMLTPLTLGVIANVTGIVRGQGRIGWTQAGTTSSGTFTTDRLDLAAAFGPVTGIAGTIRFTDLLGLVTAPHQEARIAEINPGVVVADGTAHYQLIGDNRVRVEDARWPFAGGTLALDPATLDFGQTAERRLTFRIAGLDAAAFIQQLDFPNISATGTFDGRLPMVFDQAGGRIEDGALTARGPGTLAYVGELSNAQLGTMGKLAFDALKAIRYSGLDIALAGSLDGEIVTRVRFDGVRQATGDKGLIARTIRNLPFRFNIGIRAPFRGLAGSARSYANPALLLQSARPPAPVQPAPVQPGTVQPADSAPVR